MTKETYKFQYEHWHQDNEESLHNDIAVSSDFINMHGLWPKDKKASIFDVGCGMGRFLLAFREKGYNNLSGIDIDDYQIDIAKKANLDVRLADANRFFKKNKKLQDLITLIDCLEHVDKDKQIDLLKGISRSLKEDGALAIRVPNALAPAFAYHRYIDFTHKLAYTAESLNYILKNAGFAYTTFRPAWKETKDIVKLKKPFANLLKAEFGMTDPILTSNIVVVAFKTQEALDNYLKDAPKLEINYA